VRGRPIKKDTLRSVSVLSLRVLAVVLLVLLGAGCATPPRQPLPPFVIELAPTLPPGLEPQVLLLAMRVDDTRDVADPTHIGEVQAPGGGTPPPIVGSPGAAAAVTGAMLLVPMPTGRYLVVKNSADVAYAVGHALSIALLQSKRYPLETGLLEVKVRKFWMRPSWTTTCDVVIETRLLSAGGKPLWERTLEGHVDKFEGWFTREAFERVARMALDQLTANATSAFGSADFGAAIAGSR
jgi:hypothetical protein